LRWKNFEDFCAYSRTVGGCIAGPELCRSSMIGIAGTDLMVNCTCSYADPDKQRTCAEERNRLKFTNTCTGEASILVDGSAWALCKAVQINFYIICPA